MFDIRGHMRNCFYVLIALGRAGVHLATTANGMRARARAIRKRKGAPPEEGVGAHLRTAVVGLVRLELSVLAIGQQHDVGGHHLCLQDPTPDLCKISPPRCKDPGPLCQSAAYSRHHL